ncbi:MAG: right-handed parallel beta-helix repeat-containing protein [Myxococcota bacterium]
MAVSANSDASGASYVSSATESLGQIDFLLELPKSGGYLVWARVLAPTATADSFWVSANGGDWDIYDVAEGTWSEQWQWTRVNGRTEGANPRIFTFEAGSNTLSFRGREAGAGVDVLLVTDDVDFAPTEVPRNVSGCTSSDGCNANAESHGEEIIDDVDSQGDTVCPENHIVVNPDAAHPDEFTVVVQDKDGNPVHCAHVALDLEAIGCAGTGGTPLLGLLLMMYLWVLSRRLCVSRRSFHLLRIGLLAALLQILVPSSVWAADYYVSTAGSDNNSGSSQSPFLTLQRAVSAVSAGDQVIVREGRYGSFVIDNLHGKAGAPITFMAEAGKKVTIDRYLSGGHDVGTVRFSGKTSYIILDGFEITNTDPLIDATRTLDPNVAQDRAQWVQIRDGNPRTFLYGDAVRFYSDLDTSDNHTDHIFRNLKIHHIPCMGFNGKGDRIQFIDNHIYDLGWPRSGYGWYFKGRDLLFRGNDIHDCTWGLHLYSTNHNVGLTNAVIENNRIYSNGGRIYFYSVDARPVLMGEGIRLQTSGGNNTIRNNIFYDHYDTAIYNAIPGTKIYNNTFFDNRRTINITVGDTSIINNIIANTENAIASGNNTYESVTNLIDDAPQFVNPPSDFHLKEGSDAINTGTALAQVATDFDGTARPQQGQYDIGAYEFGGTPAVDKPLCDANASGACVYFYAEAETQVIAESMAVGEDGEASGSAYVSSATESTGQIDFLVELPKSGDYIVWARVLAPSVTADSFWVSANGGAWDVYDVAEGTWSEQWQWTQVNGRDAGANPSIFAFEAGANTLTFRGREPETGLDIILVTNDLGFVPAGVPVDVPTDVPTEGPGSLPTDVPCDDGLVVNGECIAGCTPSMEVCNDVIDNDCNGAIDAADAACPQDEVELCPENYAVVNSDAAQTEEFTVVVEDQNGKPVRCAQVALDLEAVGCAGTGVPSCGLLLLVLFWIRRQKGLYAVTMVTWVVICMSPSSLLAKNYYVQTAAKGGSDSNDGTSPTNLGGGVGPWQTALHGFESVPPGNTLAFGGGTYDINRSAAITPIRSGSSSSPTIITNYNDEAVVFTHPGSGNYGLISFNSASPAKEYISFVSTTPRGIKFDMAKQPFGSIFYMSDLATNHITLKNIEITNAHASGILAGDSSNLTLDGVYLVRNGTHTINGIPQDHGIYASGPNLIIKNSHIYETWGNGIQCFPHKNTGREFYGNRIYSNGRSGIIMAEGSGKIYNNLIYNNADDGLELWRTSDAAIYQNDIRGNGQRGIKVGNGGTALILRTLVEDNTVVDNPSADIAVMSNSSSAVVQNNFTSVAISDLGTATTKSNNQIGDPGPPTQPQVTDEVPPLEATCDSSIIGDCSYLYAEAEEQKLESPMAVSANSDASGASYVSSATESLGQIDFLLELPKSGAYLVWARVLAPTATADSFWVSANGGDWDIYDVAEGTWSEQWQWTRVNGRTEGANPRIFTFEAGSNTLSFRGREAGAGVDVLLVTDDVDFAPTEVPRDVSGCASSDGCDANAESHGEETIADVDNQGNAVCPENHIVVNPDATHPDEFTVVVKDKDGNPVHCAHVALDRAVGVRQQTCQFFGFYSWA